MKSVTIEQKATGKNARAVMPWSSRANYGSLESEGDHECQKHHSDEISTIIAMFAAFIVWLVGVALFAMFLVIMLDDKDVIP